MYEPFTVDVTLVVGLVELRSGSTVPIVVSSTLTIESHLLPNFWFVRLLPLLTFVSFVITVALAPFITLTAYIFRIATVAKRTASAGPFTMS